MTLSIALSASAFSTGCDADPDPAETVDKGVAEPKGKAKASASKPATKASGAERGWTVTYSGGASGKISGKVSQITSVGGGLYVVASDLKGNSMTVGLAVTPSDTGSRDAETFNITVDKEPCEQKDGKPVALEVTNGDKASLAFTLSGTLQCEGKLGSVEIEGTFRKR